MNKLLIRMGEFPFRNIIEWMVVFAFCVVFLALTGCATPEKIEQPTNPHDARSAQALALAKIGETAKDAETQRMAILAVALLGASQPQAQVAQQGQRNGVEAFLAVLDRTTERLFGIAPALFAYRGSVRASQTSETVAAINRDVSIAQNQSFLALGQTGILGTASVGVAGVNALRDVAVRPQVPTTQLTVSGNSGPVQIGSGTQTNSSNNPVNPSPTVCFVNGTTTGCSR